MKLERFIGGMLESNGYVIYQHEGGDCFVIDPGYNAGVFLDCVARHELRVKGILLTHHHYDHVGAVEKLRQEWDAPVYMHIADCDAYGKRVNVYMQDGDVIMLEDEELRVVSTPGHTKGSVCFLSAKSNLAFTGDTIFNVDLGRTDLEDGSPREMEDSIRNVVALWSNETMIYPGHGDGCTMKTVRRINREFQEIAGDVQQTR